MIFLKTFNNSAALVQDDQGQEQVVLGKGVGFGLKKGDEVKAGDELVKFDIDEIHSAGYIVTTPIVVTNSKDYEKVSVVCQGEVKVGQEILDLEGATEKEASTNENPQIA